MKYFKLITLLVSLLYFTATCSAQKFERYRTLKDTTYPSQNLEYKKHIQITVPIEYQENLHQSFPLIIIFDMQNQRSYNYMLQTIDYLTANEQIPSAVIIGVEAGEDSKRWLETQLKISSPRGLGEKNEAYVFNELIPLAKSNFKAGNFTTLIGHSRYGYFTSYLLAKHLEQLNAVISLSPFLEQPNMNLADLLPKEIEKSNLKHTIYYRFAMGNDYPDDYKKLSQVAKSSGFNNKNVNVDGWIFPQADHNATPGLAIARSLYEVFEFWSSRQEEYIADKNKDINKIFEIQKTIAEHYGTPLPDALGILNGKGWALYNNADYINAMAAWRQLIREYPNFSEGYLNIAKCQKKLQQPTAQTLNEFKSDLKGSSFYTEKQKADLLKEADAFLIGI